jgi:hypothetical protein
MSATQYATQLLEQELVTLITPVEQAKRAADFLRQGPLQPDVSRGWPRERDEDNSGAPKTYRLPPKRPTAGELREALQKLAAGERPARDYPEDFFSRDVIYADHD